VEEKRVDKIIKPDKYVIPIKTTQIHGISQSDAIRKGIPFMDMAIELVEDIQDVKYIVGHNIISYDIPVLLNNLKLYNIQVDLEKYIVEDTIKMVMPFTNNTRIKLQDLYTYLYNQSFNNAHNALYDVIATKDCYIKIKYNQADLSGLETVIKCNSEQRKEQMGNTIITFGKFRNSKFSDILNKYWYCEWVLDSGIDTRDSKLLRSYIMDNKRIVFSKLYQQYVQNQKIDIIELVNLLRFDKSFEKIFNRQNIGTEYLELENQYQPNKLLDPILYNELVNNFIRYFVMKNRVTIIDYDCENIKSSLDNSDSKLNKSCRISLLDSYNRFQQGKANLIDLSNVVIMKRVAIGDYKYKDLINGAWLSDPTKKYLLELTSNLLYNKNHIQVERLVVQPSINRLEHILLDKELIKIVEQYRSYDFYDLIIYYEYSNRIIEKLQIYELTTNHIYTLETNKLPKDPIKNIITELFQ
jgi:DNA polymerase III epsilon subunit-like protein